MSAIALVGGLTARLEERTLDRLILPLVALAAGSLIGGALFHLVPAALVATGDLAGAMTWLALGFVSFLVLEQALHFHHCRRPSRRRPLTYLILLGDALHNFIGGLAVAGTFILDVRLGVMTWLAAAAHEVPQELGDFGVLIHGGWPRRSALLWNLASGLTFLVGGLVAYFAARHTDVSALVPFAAGNFLYIGAADLVPEIKEAGETPRSLETLAAFVIGLGALWLLSRLGL
ncbi:MAG: ZIP family metal transporter [Gemmatimonadota bacterium]